MYNRLASHDTYEAQLAAEEKVYTQFKENADIDSSMEVERSGFRKLESGEIYIDTHVNLYDLIDATDEFSLFEIEKSIGPFFDEIVTELLKEKGFRFSGNEKPSIKIMGFQEDNIYLGITVEVWG